jgi:hypothetical protein
MLRITQIVLMWEDQKAKEILFKHLHDRQKKFAGKVALSIVVVGSKGDESKSLCSPWDIHYVEFKNSPLNDKVNKAFHVAREVYDPDYYFSSDNILDDEAFQNYLDKIEEEYNFLGFMDIYMYDVDTGVTKFWKGYPKSDRRYSRIVYSLMMSKSVMEALDYDFSKPGGVTSEDDVMERLYNVGFLDSCCFHVGIDGIIFELKGKSSLSNIELFQSYGQLPKEAMEFLRC